MSNTITSASHAQAVAQTTSKPTTAALQPAASKPQAAPRDTVQISNASKILQEAVETSAQTSKEAAAGDIQAKNLLAREAAAHASTK